MASWLSVITVLVSESKVPDVQDNSELAQRMFFFFIHLWNLRKISIFLAFSGSFAMENDNIHIFFFTVLVANFEFAGFAPKQKY